MKVAIVLGNRMEDDGSLSKECLKRLDLLMKADENCQFDKVILSGGIANKKAGISEAFAMKKELEKRGLDSEILIPEDKSGTTKENAIYSTKILKELNPSEVVVITSVSHFTRGYLNPAKLFKKEFAKEELETNLSFFSGF